MFPAERYLFRQARLHAMGVHRRHREW
jgi:hypothetical protein